MRKFLSWILVLTPVLMLFATGNDLVSGLGNKVLLYRLVALLGVLSVLILSFSEHRDVLVDRSRTLLSRPLFWAISINMALLAVSTILAHDPYVAFFGEPTRGEGFLTLFTMYVIGVLTMLVFTQKDWHRLMYSLSLSGIGLFVYELVQEGRGIGRPYSLVGNPIFLAIIFCFVFWSGWYFATRPRTAKTNTALYGWIIMLMSILGSFLAKTRGTILGLAVAVLVTSLVLLFSGKEKRLFGFAARAIGGVVLGAALLFGTLFGLTRNSTFWSHVPGLDRFSATAGNATTVESRLMFAKITLKGFKNDSVQEKLFGWGWDNYGFFWDQNYIPAAFFYDPAMADRAHNKLLDELAMTGIIGLLSYIAIWIVFFRETRMLIHKDFALAIGALFLGVVYLVHNLTAFDSVETYLLFYLLLAMTTFYARET